MMKHFHHKFSQINLLKSVIKPNYWHNYFTFISDLNYGTSKLTHIYSTVSKRKSPGLFNIVNLSSQREFNKLQKSVIKKSESLLSNIISLYHKNDSELQIISVMDDLSDHLCILLDLSNFLRICHQSQKFKDFMNEVFRKTNIVVQSLNSNEQLHSILQTLSASFSYQASNIPEDDSHYGREYMAVLKSFLDDFTIGAADKTMTSSSHREKINQLSNSLIEISFEFSKMCHDYTEKYIPFSTVSAATIRKKYPWLGSRLVKVNATRYPKLFELGSEFLFLDEHLASYLLSNTSDSKLLLSIYKTVYGASGDSLQILQKLLLNRLWLSQLNGYRSYCHWRLRDHLFDTSEKVLWFLEKEMERIKPDAQKELCLLEECKGSKLETWEYHYMVEKYKKSLNISTTTTISEYLSIQSCLNGISLIMETLFGLSLEEAPSLSSEIWSPIIFKYSVKNKVDNKFIGYIYGDFFKRDSQHHQICHYTIRTFKKSRNVIPGLNVIDGRAENQDFPISVISCDFKNPKTTVLNYEQENILKEIHLSWQEASNLFHEFGHAIHALLSRSSFHAISGTRCHFDMLEIPSCLMECFFEDYRIMSLWAKHFRTGESISKELFEKVKYEVGLFSNIQQLMQIVYAYVDQKYHSVENDDILDKDLFWTSKMYNDIQSRIHILEFVPETHPQMRLSHLANYAGVYYVYLLSKRIGKLIWDKYTMTESPDWGLLGSKLREELLEVSGTRNLKDILNRLDIQL